jgi:hypothetical protein
MVMSYRVNFAVRGVANGPGLPSWPAYSPRRPGLLRPGDQVGPRAPVPVERVQLLAR